MAFVLWRPRARQHGYQQPYGPSKSSRWNELVLCVRSRLRPKDLTNRAVTGDVDADGQECPAGDLRAAMALA